MSNIDTFVITEGSRFLGELKTFLRIPSISTEPSHASDCRRAAEWVRDHLKQLGCPKVELLASDTHPVVWGEGPEAPG
jgi:acetylornithine deacetylase/succinyl-diaminopimelate desuccinylase-like protein